MIPGVGHGDLACALGPAIKGFKVLVAGAPEARPAERRRTLGLSRSYPAAGDLQEAEAAIKKGIDLGPSTGFVHRMPCGLMRS